MTLFGHRFLSTRPTERAADLEKINKRLEAENAALRRAQIESQGLLESVPDAMVVVNQARKIVLVNRQVENLFGYRREELLGQAVEMLVPERFWGAQPSSSFFAEPGVRALGTESQLRGRRRDGVEFPVEISLTPLNTKGGLLFSSAIRDVTEWKRAEEELRQSEGRFRQIAETIAEVYWTADPRLSRMLYVSPAYERVWGRSRQSLYENPRLFLDSIHADDRERVVAKLQAQTAGQSFDHEYRIVDSDGSVRWIWDRGAPVRDEDGQVIRYVGVAVEITGRKQAEAEKARLVTAIDQSADAVMITNSAGDIEYVNPAFSRINGYSREEALGHNPRILKSDRQEPGFYQQLWATLRKGQAWHGELINRRKDGSLYTAEMNFAPLRDEGGRITHFIATKQDVTERKQMEDRLRQGQKMEAVGRLAGGVAHDFNNLLTLINGYSALVLGRLDSNDSNWGQIEEIRRAGERAASLTRQLLAFSRRQVLAPRILDLSAVVGDIEKMLRRLMGEDIDLEIVRGSPLGQVKADPGQIEQVLVNLAVNARDAMPEGGKFVIESANVELDQLYADRHPEVVPGRFVVLTVTDSGIGMSAEIQTHIFEPFFTTKEKDKGTGLGLATVYGIVKQSGGYIWVSSEPGCGTTFNIYLPRIDETEDWDQSAEPQGESVAGSETILLVEDEEAVRALAAEVLRECGYQVLESTPEDALQVSERHTGPIHLLLTDVVMPRVSGRKIADLLVPARMLTKVLYMSGYPDGHIVHDGVLQADTALLQKPFTPISLARKVREVLDASS